MAKKSRTKARDRANDGEVGPREPCPCGSGKRYKACHGSSGGVFVARPFQGLAAERDLVAMREFVPSATAPLPVGDRTVLLASLLPAAAPAMVRDSGEIWLGLQVRHAFGDPSRDLAAVLEKALGAEEPGVVGLVDPPGPGARLQDLVTNVPIEVTVHDGFAWWLDDDQDDDQDADPEGDADGDRDPAALEQANTATAPTARLASVEAAYWVDAGSKEHLRWVLPQDEQVLLDAFARLHAAGEDAIIEGSKLVGMFRAHGLLTPVWDLPSGTGADALEEPAAAFHGRIDAALMVRDDLTSEERAARAMLANHQVTLR